MEVTVASLHKTKGSVLVATALALLLIMGMAGLAIDMGHHIDRKARLQTSVDAAALEAAMKLLQQAQNNIGVSNPTSLAINYDPAEAAGSAIHLAHLNAYGSSWFDTGPTSSANIQFCWSTDLQSFPAAGETCQPTLTEQDLITSPGFFVRAEVLNSPFNNFIAQIMPGIGTKRISRATAVAGTIGLALICDVTPMFVCDNTTPTSATTYVPDSYCGDGSCWGEPVTTNPNFDYTHYQPTSVFSARYFGVKTASQSIPTTGPTGANGDSCLTDYPQNGCAVVYDGLNNINVVTTLLFNPQLIVKNPASQWNFAAIPATSNQYLLNLIDINGQGEGASSVAADLVYGQGCLSTVSMDTQPGTVSSIQDAINTLIGAPPKSNSIKNAASYMDWDTNHPITFHSYWMSYGANSSYTTGNRYKQRMLNVPVMNCRDPSNYTQWNANLNGNQTVGYPLGYLGTACFFLARKMYNSNETGHLGTGSNSNESFVIMEHVDNIFCPPVQGLPGGNPTNLLDAKVVLYEHYATPDS